MLIKKTFPAPLHVDDFIDGHYLKDCYARWVLSLMRLPAVLQIDFRPWASQYRLFCKYKGEWHRVVLASRMGDIGLTKNFESDQYAIRVDVETCSEWAAEPPKEPTS